MKSAFEEWFDNAVIEFEGQRNAGRTHAGGRRNPQWRPHDEDGGGTTNADDSTSATDYTARQKKRREEEKRKREAAERDARGRKKDKEADEWEQPDPDDVPIDDTPIPGSEGEPTGPPKWYQKVDWAKYGLGALGALLGGPNGATVGAKIGDWVSDQDWSKLGDYLPEGWADDADAQRWFTDFVNEHQRGNDERVDNVSHGRNPDGTPHDTGGGGNEGVGGGGGGFGGGFGGPGSGFRGYGDPNWEAPGEYDYGWDAANDKYGDMVNLASGGGQQGPPPGYDPRARNPFLNW